jgi:cell division septation protein DedD
VRAFTVQFYALMVEERARELASQIQVDGQRARVVPSVQAGTPVFRVVLGPYPTREEAERVGSRAGHVFWVFEGLP